MRKGLLALAFIIIVGVGAFFVFTKKGTSPAPSSGQAESDNSALQQNDDASSSKPGAATVTITYTKEGFEPKNAAAKMGDIIEVRNDSSSSLQFSSDPHPAHTGNRELNQSSIPAGGRQTFTVTRKGVFGFHNHLDSRLTGTLVVE